MHDVHEKQLDLFQDNEGSEEVLELVREEQFPVGSRTLGSRILGIGERGLTLVGLTGKAGAGKTTAADYLTDRYGFYQVSLADPIKELLNNRFGWTPEMWQDRDWKEGEDPDYGVQPMPLVECGQRTRYFSPRSWAQWLGTEVGRALYKDVWVDAAIASAYELYSKGHTRIVIPDVRFDNEAVAVNGESGIVIEMLSDLPTTSSSHASENGVRKDLIEYDVQNVAGDVSKMFNQLDIIMFLEGVTRTQ